MSFRYGKVLDAASDGHLVKLKEFKASGVDMFEKYTNGSNALHFAAEAGQLECMKFLIHDCGFDIEATGGRSWAAFKWCVHNKRTECAKYLLSLGAKCVLDDQTIEWTIDHDEFSVLLNHNPGRVDQIARVALRAALSDRTKNRQVYTQIVGRLLDMGARLTDEMFEWAVINDDVALLERLYQRDTFPIQYRDAQITDVGFTLIQLAANNGNCAALRLLLSKSKFMIDYERKSVMHDEYMSRGTALYYAVHYKQPQAAEILLAAGAKPKVPCQNNNTALHIAAQSGCLESVISLLKHDSSLLNMRNDSGNTALHRAAMFKHLPVIKYLIANGAEKTIKNNDGHTPVQLLGVSDTTIDCVAALC